MTGRGIRAMLMRECERRQSLQTFELENLNLEQFHTLGLHVMRRMQIQIQIHLEKLKFDLEMFYT